MKFQEAIEIVLCLASQGALDENHVDEEMRSELDKQNEAMGIVYDFKQNCDMSEFDADDEQDQQPSEG